MGDVIAEVPPEVVAPPRETAGPIIPVRGLPIVAAVIAGLVAAIASNSLWALNFLHVSCGALWTAIDLFMGFVIGPTLARMEVPARIALTRRLMPQMLLIMPTLVLVTLTTGWQLARYFGYLVLPYPQHWWLVASYIVVGVMAIVAYGVLEPANISVLLELRRPRPNTLLIGRLMRRFVFTAGVTGIMQVATLVIMTRITTW
jgi:hypothetical protein